MRGGFAVRLGYSSLPTPDIAECIARLAPVAWHMTMNQQGKMHQSHSEHRGCEVRQNENSLR